MAQTAAKLILEPIWEADPERHRLPDRWGHSGDDMLPLLRNAPSGQIVNASSGLGSLTQNGDRAYPYAAAKISRLPRLLVKPVRRGALPNWSPTARLVALRFTNDFTASST